MPPKRQPSTRKSAKKATADSNAAQEETKEGVEKEVDANAETTSPPATLPAEPITAQEEATSTAETAILDSADATNPPQPSQVATARRPAAKPRNVQRKSLAQRNELAKAEADRKAEADAKTAQEAAKSKHRPSDAESSDSRKFFDRIPHLDGTSAFIGRDRGRGWVTRGRGRGAGRGGYTGNVVASGPFSAGQVSKESKPKWGRTTSTPRATASAGERGGRGGRGGGGGSGARVAAGSRKTAITTIAASGSFVKKEGETSGRSRTTSRDDHVRMEDQRDVGLISSDESEDEQKGTRRMNVDDFGGVIDLTGEEDDFDPFAPIRVRRVTHEQRSIGINADGATNQDGTITVDANDTTTGTISEKKKGKQRAQEAEIVDEKPSHPLVWSDSDDQREAQIKPDPDGPAEAEVVRDSAAAPVSDDHPREPPSSPETKRKTKEKIRLGSVERPNYQTREENEEWDRIQDDLDVVRAELGVPANQDKDGDTAMADDSATTDPRAEKVYLFQFPPILPDLTPIAIKSDPDAPGTAHGAEPMQVDVEDVKPIIVSDEDGAAKDSDANRPTKLPSGAVGKMRVHASGRVTLDWGGTSLCVGMGTAATFLQDVIVAHVPRAKEDGDEKVSGHAASMGQVKGKFVVTPDWDAILS